MNLHKIIKEEIDDFDWIRDIKPSLKVFEIKNQYSQGFNHFFKTGDTVFLSGILMLETDQEPNNNNHIILNDLESIVKSVKIKTIDIILPPEITSSEQWITNIGAANVLNLGGIREDDNISVLIPTNRDLNESEENDFDWVRGIGSEKQNIISRIQKFILSEVPIADIEIDWERTRGNGEYFGKIWLYDRFYELYQYDNTFTVRCYESNDYGEYHQYDQYENLNQHRLITILSNELLGYYSYRNRELNESEEDEFEWVKVVKPTLYVNDLKPGDKFSIKDHSNNWIDAINLGRVQYGDGSYNDLCNILVGNANLSMWSTRSLDDIEEEQIDLSYIIYPNRLHFFNSGDWTGNDVDTVNFPTDHQYFEE